MSVPSYQFHSLILKLQNKGMSFSFPPLKLPNKRMEEYSKIFLWGQKVLEVSAHSISSPRATPRRKKCLGTNEENPNCQNVLPRATLSSTGQNHGRKKRHIARGHPLEDHKRDSKPYGLAIGK